MHMYPHEGMEVRTCEVVFIAFVFSLGEFIGRLVQWRLRWHGRLAGACISPCNVWNLVTYILGVTHILSLATYHFAKLPFYITHWTSVETQVPWNLDIAKFLCHHSPDTSHLRLKEKGKTWWHIGARGYLTNYLSVAKAAVIRPSMIFIYATKQSKYSWAQPKTQ